MTTSDYSPNGIRVSLHNVGMWQKFYPINEMKVSKHGRKLFPELDVNIGGLDPQELYSVSLYLERVGDYKYEFTKDEESGTSQWEDSGLVYKYGIPIDKKCHKEGARDGTHWMAKPVSFSQIFITNDTEFDETKSNKTAILVESRHKYQPVIVVKRLSDGKEEEFRLTMTEFIVVTAYKNLKIVELKTENNKFASGFRANGQHRARRVKRSATVTLGIPASPTAKKTTSSPQGYQNQMAAPTAVTPPPNNIQNQPMATPPTMAVTPSIAPSTMTPPAMTMTTGPSQGSMYYPPTMTPSMTPYTMTPQNVTPPTITVTASSQTPMYNQNQMTTPPTMAVTPSIAPSTMTLPAMTMTTPPSQGPMYYPPTMTPSMTPYTMTPQNVTPPSMTTLPAHNYTMNQNWNPFGTWDMPQMGGGAPMPSPQPQWNTMYGAAPFGHPGSMPQNNNYNGADMSFLHGSSGVDFDFRF